MSGSRLALCAVCIATWAVPDPPARAFCPRAGTASTSQRRVLEALASPTSLACRGAPLDRVLDYLGRLHHVDVRLDRNSLAAAGIAADAPVTESLEGVSLRSALRPMLRDLKLGYVLRGGTLLVTSEGDAAERVYTAAYPVGDLLGPRAAAGAVKLDAAGLVAAMRSAIAPETWKDEGGGAGLVRAVPPGEAQFLAVTQTGAVHERVADFLEHVRLALRAQGEGTAAPAGRVPLRLAAEQRIRRALEEPVGPDFAFIECPLSDVVAKIASVHKLPVRCDLRAMEEGAGGPDTPVTTCLKGVPLRSWLTLVLGDLDLAWVVENEVVLITTPEEAEGHHLSTRLHAVDDPPERRGPSGLHRVEDDDLTDLLTCVVAPVSWEDVGGPGIAAVMRKDAARWLVVTQSQAIHEEIDGLLDQLRRAASGPAAIRPDGTVRVPRPAEARIRKALASPITLQFEEAPLQDVLDEIERRSGISIWVERMSLEDVGIGTDTPVTCNLKDVTLENALASLLRPLDLTWDVADDVLLVTTPEQSECRLRVAVYPVTDLLPAGWVRSEAMETLMGAVTSTVSPNSWDEVGGAGSIAPVSLGVEQALVVSQTREVHARIAALLRQLRRIAAADPRAPAAESLPPEDGPEAAAEARIAKALAQPTVMEFIESPLTKVIEYVGDRHGIDVRLDARALEDVGLAPDTPVTFRIKGVSLRAASKLVLRPLDLTFSVRDGALLVTTPEVAESFLRMRIHSVTDLLERMGTEDPDFESLIDAITATVRPTTWDEVGGPGSIAPLSVGRAHLLVFSQTDEVHDEVASFLERLRVAAGLVKPPDPPAKRGPTPEERIEKALKSPVTLAAEQTTLADVLDALGDQVPVEIQVDRRALEEVGIGTDTPVTCDFRKVTLAHALEQVLGKTELKYLVADEVILVTSAEEAACRLTTEVYRVDWRKASSLAPAIIPGDFDRLLEAVMGQVAPESWDEAGGPGSMAPLRFGRTDVLAVSQTSEVHRKLARALGAPPVRAP